MKRTEVETKMNIPTKIHTKTNNGLYKDKRQSQR
jgi:hypothetical protein